jgi:heme/copper-type cytochrome/quinol oxidase subunit 2
MLIPLVLFVILVAVVVGANASRKKGSMTEAAYSNLVSAVSVVVTIVALVVLYMRLKG